jgi:hypothetical protein
VGGKAESAPDDFTEPLSDGAINSQPFFHFPRVSLLALVTTLLSLCYSASERLWLLYLSLQQAVQECTKESHGSNLVSSSVTIIRTHN